MKISCQSCQAKYTIADEKVLGKIVKIRCKKCGATIVINGNDSDATQANTAQTEQVLDYTAANEQWTVNVAEGDQRTLTQAEIVAEYKSGVVNDDTFCWKDGMNDWLPVREIESLYAACAMGPGPALHTAGEFAPMAVSEAQRQAAPATDDEFPTQVGGDQNFSLFGGGASAPAETNGNGASLFGAAQPARRNSSRPAPTGAAARRTGGRGNQGADLFGNVSQAGGEDDVMTSAPQGGAHAAGADVGNEKLTGQRNENSVLFSLNALTQTAPKDTSGAPVADGSGLIDIKALSASMGSEAPKSQRHVDDIMNLGGGGAFSAALAAPILAPPSTHGDEYTMGGTPARSKNTLLYVIIGGCVFLGMAMIIVALIVTGGKKDNDAATAPTGSGMPTAAPTDSVAMNTAPTTSVTASAAAPTGPVAKAPNVGGGQAATGGGGGGTKPHAAGGGDSPPPAAVPDTPPAAKSPPSLAQAMAAAAPKDTTAPAAAPAGGTAPFDRGAAAAALGGVNVATCKKPDGPSGSGHVKVTFAPSGSVSTAEVDSPPFSGTGVGGCIAGKFRAAHIPAFGGGPVTVGKSFSLN